MKIIDAVFENGVFHPCVPLILTEGSHVSVRVPDPPAMASDKSMTVPEHDSGQGPEPASAKAARLYKSFGCISAEDAREMTRIIEERFGQVNPDEWR